MMRRNDLLMLVTWRNASGEMILLMLVSSLQQASTTMSFLYTVHSSEMLYCKLRSFSENQLSSGVGLSLGTCYIVFKRFLNRVSRTQTVI